MRAFLLIAFVLALLSCGQMPQDITLAWDAPTTNADGSPLTDLAGYKLYYSGRSGSEYDYLWVVDVGNVTQYTVAGLVCGGTYYFAVTAYDTSGNESGHSNEIWWGC